MTKLVFEIIKMSKSKIYNPFQKKVISSSKSVNFTKFLWNTNVSGAKYGSYEKYYEHLFSQYQIFITAADKFTERRYVTNTFFLSINTFFVTSISLSYDKFLSNLNQKWILIFPLAALLLFCLLWWKLLQSYRQLNKAKYEIIHEYEKYLPSSPYLAEWMLLEEGKNPKVYTSMVYIESVIPFIIGLIYISIVLSLLIQTYV